MPPLPSLLAQFNLTTLLENVSDRLFLNPLTSAIQAGIVLGASLLIFLIFFATRDVLLRSRSLTMQVFSILLVASLPIVGFLAYLLIRPARTVREREMERAMAEMGKVLRACQEMLQAMKTAQEKKPPEKKRLLTKFRELKLPKRPTQQELPTRT